jgi:predicted DNA-binding protein (MmcQ/YjbR family)
MTREHFRRMALGLPGSLEQSHMGHPDFRVSGKIFATLDYPGEGWAMVKLSPERQARFVAATRLFSSREGQLG